MAAPRERLAAILAPLGLELETTVDRDDRLVISARWRELPQPADPVIVDRMVVVDVGTEAGRQMFESGILPRG